MRFTFDPWLSGTYLETNIFVLRVYTRFMKSAAQPTFDPMILWISWFEPHAKATFSGSDCFVPQHWGIKNTGCIKLRDKVDFWSQTQWNLFGNQYLCLASLYPIHEKCRAGHFWSHDLVDLMVWSPQFEDQHDAKAKDARSKCFDSQHWKIKVSRRPLLIPWSCGSDVSILTIRGSKWREVHSYGIRMCWAPALGDQNYPMCKTTGWGSFLIPDSVELIWKPISLFCEFIPDSWKVPRSPLLIPWSCGFHGLIPTRRPHFRDQIGFCPSIGGSKLRDV